MAYATPAVNIYQQLATSGGLSDVTPDLEACIIGPAYNIVSYVAGDIASLIKTTASSISSGTATILSGSTTLTFVSAPPFLVGDAIMVPTATAGGTILQAKVIAASGLVLTLDTAAGATATGVSVTKQGLLTSVSSLVNNTYALPAQVPGQVVDNTSIVMYATNALVETISTGFTGYQNSNSLTYSTAVATAVASTTVASASVAVSNATMAAQFSIGDTVSIPGAGLAGIALIAKITGAPTNTSFTLSVAATLLVTNATMTKIAVSNVNSTTSTLMIEAGDQVVISYTDTASVAQNQTSTVVSVSSATGIITNVVIADVLVAGVAASTTPTLAIAALATTFTLSSATNFAAGDNIVIRGAGVGGTDHYAVLTTLTGAVVSALSPATVTAVLATAVIQKQARVTLKTRKVYNNQIIPAVKPISGGAAYDISATATSGNFILNAVPEVVYGKVISGEVHVGYKALRTDLSAIIQTINDQVDNLGTFGVVNENNPLALGCQITLANTTTRVRCIAVASNDQAGYLAALDLAQSERVYGLVPLTQDPAICQAFSLHAQSMSTPANALWRAAYVNTKIPTIAPVGNYTSAILNVNSGNNAITLVGSDYILNSSNSTFISDNVVAGDTLNTSASGALQILSVISNTQLKISTQSIVSAISFYITRTLSKTQRAAAVAAMSASFGSNRVVHVQPDTVVINIGGRAVSQPGYYLACALAGLVAGFPSQQGLTNIAIAGISDLSNSNFTFTRAQLNVMAAAGTFLFIQDTAGGLPYVRHELTTDMSVYQYREVQAVKNWDFLSYYYFDALKAFIGKWNITPDTLNTIRQTIVSGSELLKTKKLPRIGAPLVDYKITKLEQNATSIDRVTVVVATTQPAVLNFADVYLVI